MRWRGWRPRRYRQKSPCSCSTSAKQKNARFVTGSAQTSEIALDWQQIVRFGARAGLLCRPFSRPFPRPFQPHSSRSFHSIFSALAVKLVAWRGVFCSRGGRTSFLFAAFEIF